LGGEAFQAACPLAEAFAEAAVGHRVMLDKGSCVVEGVAVLGRLRTRMGEHPDRKVPTLRALRSW
jgi:pyruvate kinase